MTPVSAILGASAPPRRIEHAGRVYEFRPLTQALKAEWERWLEAKAVSSLLPLEGKVSDERFRDLVSDVSGKAAAGAYGFFGDISRKALLTPVGALKLASLLAGCDESDLASLMANRGPEVRHALESVLSESLPKKRPGPDASMIEGDPCPNG